MTKAEIETAVKAVEQLAQLDVGPDLLLAAAIGRLLAQGTTLAEINQKVVTVYTGFCLRGEKDIIHSE